MTDDKSKIWGGRFQKEMEEVVEKFNASISFDARLYAQDIKGSMAHCRMLAKQGIISEEDSSQILGALAEIKREMDRGEISLDEMHEDIHTLVEKVLVEKIGPDAVVAMGNGRNDQLMLKAAGVGVAVILGEGASSETLMAADVVCTSILSALDLLLNPLRLIATLRS